MDKPAKRKGPPTKAEIIQRAVNDGIVDSAAALENLSVKGIRLFLKEAKAKQQQQPEEIGNSNGPIHDNALKANDELPRLEPAQDLPEIKEPNCGHIFRKVREIHKHGNIVVNICNICGWRETVI